MKYLLKHKVTGEEHLCDKVVIDGFDYYVSDELIKDVKLHYGKWQIENKTILNKFPTYLTDLSSCRLVISTNNPNIDLPQVIDEVVYEAYKAVGEDIPYNELLVTAWCDGYSKSKEETSFSEQDMIEFNEWYCNDFLNDIIGLNGREKMEKYQHLKNKGVTKELLEIWKQQRPKTIWYE